jgi:PAS domain S-box-containing protein
MRKKRLNKLESKEYADERSNRLIQYLTDYIYTVRIKNGKVTDTYHGPGCLAVTGYSSDDYRKDPELWYRMVYEADKEIVLAQAQQALEGKNVEPIEHRIVHRDGFLRWVKSSIVLAKNENGEVISYDGLINDISDYKKAEALANVKQKQLIQADKMVSLGILVSGIAHEINNPNNFILLNAELFMKALEDIKPILKEYYEENGDFLIGGMPYSTSYEKLTKSLRSIAEGANRIHKITQSLTNYAKQDPDEFSQSVDMNWVVENAIIITGNLIKNSTKNFSINYNRLIPSVKGNKQQLEQVIINLINNSCQSLSSSEESISISVMYDEEKEQVITEVADEGMGIKESHLKRIFDPFFTTKRNTGGTGLGLSISYNIVKSHGGELEINSSPGKGTTCKLILPIERKETEA